MHGVVLAGERVNNHVQQSNMFLTLPRISQLPSTAGVDNITENISGGGMETGGNPGKCLETECIGSVENVSKSPERDNAKSPGSVGGLGGLLLKSTSGGCGLSGDARCDADLPRQPQLSLSATSISSFSDIVTDPVGNTDMYDLLTGYLTEKGNAMGPPLASRDLGVGPRGGARSSLLSSGSTNSISTNSGSLYLSDRQLRRLKLLVGDNVRSLTLHELHDKAAQEFPNVPIRYLRATVNRISNSYRETSMVFTRVATGEANAGESVGEALRRAIVGYSALPELPENMDDPDL